MSINERKRKGGKKGEIQREGESAEDRKRKVYILRIASTMILSL